MLTLYTVPTANGQRASIALEECGIDYRVVPCSIGTGEQFSEAFKYVVHVFYLKEQGK